MPKKSSTLIDALRSNLLGSDSSSFCDVVLLCSDGEKVPAVRALLAVRSPYFKSLFSAGFAEQNLAEVSVLYTASVVKEVITFAYTDDSPLLLKCESAVRERNNGKRRAAEAFAEDVTADDLINVVELVVAADYFQFNELCSRIAEALAALVQSTPSSTCLVLEAIRRHPVSDAMKTVLDPLKRTLRKVPQECLMVEDIRRRDPKRQRREESPTYIDSGVLMLGPVAMEEVLKDEDLSASDSYLFQVLYYWATDGKSWSLLKDKEMVRREASAAEACARQTTAGNENINQSSTDGLASENPSPSQSTRQPTTAPTDEDANVHVGGLFSLSTSQPQTPRSDRDATAKRNVSRSGREGATEVSPVDKSRWEQAKRMVRHINLEQLKPSFVRDYVQPSGLIDLYTILNVFMEQALEAERGRALNDSFRGGSVWENGTKKVTEESVVGYRLRVLTTPWLKAGRHEWTFRIDKESDCTWFGVVGAMPMELDCFGVKDLGWAYCTNGNCMEGGHIQKRLGPVVPEGETIKMMLNLTRGGTLTILVDGVRESKPFRAFLDMKKSSKQFRPAVYLKRPASITLVAEKHTME